MEKKLYRSKNKVFGGVCSGLSNYFNIDIVLVRILFTLGLIFSCGFPFFLLYLLLWIVLPLDETEIINK
jgi:phage shock protein C